MDNLIASTDFIEYYTCAKLFLSGQNCYNPELLRGLQISLGRPDTKETLMMWNPPHILILFSIFPLLSADLAFIIWTILNLFFFYDIIKMSYESNKWKNFRWQKKLIVCVLIGIVFAPILCSLRIGQLGIFLTWSFLKFYHFYSKDKLIIAAPFLMALTFKPHLFILLFITILLIEIRNKRFILIGSALSFFCISNLLVLMINPKIFSDWIYTLYNRDRSQTFIGPEEWDTSAILNWLETVFPITNPILYGNILWITIIISFLIKKFFYTNTKSRNLNTLFISAPISVAFSPFVWFFDLVILIPLVLKSIQNISNKKKKSLIDRCTLIIISFILIYSQPLGHLPIYKLYGWFGVSIILCCSLFNPDIWLVNNKLDK